MYLPLKLLSVRDKRVVLLLTNGFEDRVVASVSRLHEARIRPDEVIVMRYPGERHTQTDLVLDRYLSFLGEEPTRISQFRASGMSDCYELLKSFDPDRDEVVIDITGFARALLLEVLTVCYRRGLPMLVLYTEAQEYYPTLSEFQPFLNFDHPSDAFFELTEYEDADVVYSSRCDVEVSPSLPGKIFPNHPVLLIGFLTFKRSRLSRVLGAFETNRRILLRGEPVRDDLKWRAKALDIINFDIIDDNRDAVFSVSTLDWNDTYAFLERTYNAANTRYRFNVILAPLGGKMQTLAAWLFAVRNPDVTVVTSTPQTIFEKKYSVGATTTHLIALT